ncbi:hypothetical protein EJ07DRAFT_156523 [Lizonia empirigonia]|nr:hypothetical protein EJ07DRAFT_156523 [Lizonia empirigonia]
MLYCLSSRRRAFFLAGAPAKSNYWRADVHYSRRSGGTVKKSAKTKTLRRGVKEVVKASPRESQMPGHSSRSKRLDQTELPILRHPPRSTTKSASSPSPSRATHVESTMCHFFGFITTTHTSSLHPRGVPFMTLDGSACECMGFTAKFDEPVACFWFRTKARRVQQHQLARHQNKSTAVPVLFPEHHAVHASSSGLSTKKSRGGLPTHHVLLAEPGMQPRSFSYGPSRHAVHVHVGDKFSTTWHHPESDILSGPAVEVHPQGSARVEAVDGNTSSLKTTSSLVVSGRRRRRSRRRRRRMWRRWRIWRRIPRVHRVRCVAGAVAGAYLFLWSSVYGYGWYRSVVIVEREKYRKDCCSSAWAGLRPSCQRQQHVRNERKGRSYEELALSTSMPGINGVLLRSGLLHP